MEQKCAEMVMALLLSLPFWGEGLGLHGEPAAGPRLTERGQKCTRKGSFRTLEC